MGEGGSRKQGRARRVVVESPRAFEMVPSRWPVATTRQLIVLRRWGCGVALGGARFTDGLFRTELGADNRVDCRHTSLVLFGLEVFYGQG